MGPERSGAMPKGRMEFVTEPFNGLRFDIYERVHLPDDVAAIEELEEIELVPHMQAVPQDDHVLLKGHLLLSGLYRAQAASDGVSQLEHWIPVEITLPMNRVDRVEDLAVQIDNFDVDLLSARSLNVTGVLALRGFQATAPQIPVWHDDSFTVVHQAPAVAEPQHAEEVPVEAQRFPQETEQAGAAVDAALPDTNSASHLRPDSLYDTSMTDYTPPYFPTSSVRESGFWPNAYEEPVTTADPEPQQESDLEQWIRAQEANASAVYEPVLSDPDAYSAEFYATDEVQEQSGWGDLSSSSSSGRPETEWTKAEETVPAPEEKSEMKVALGTKPVDAAVPTFSGVGLLSQLGEKGAAREAELQAMRTAQAEAEAAEAADHKPSRTSTGDELEWTRLFLSKGADAEPFRRLKICIVQREETLDTIAARYHVQSRELQLYNRLSDPYLSAGQTLFIP